jgi:probable addiction module antidote protein
MTTMLKPWDVVEHLDSEEAIVAYLDAALSEGDLALIAAALSDIARAKGMSEILRGFDDIALSPSGGAAPRATPDFPTILKVMHQLGYDLRADVMAAE